MHKAATTQECNPFSKLNHGINLDNHKPHILQFLPVLIKSLEKGIGIFCKIESVEMAIIINLVNRGTLSIVQFRSKLVNSLK